MDKIVDEGGDITYEPKPLNEISNVRANTGNVNMNNYRMENLASLPDLTSIESIIATPKTAVNVDTMGTYTTLSLALNTAYCGPLFSTMNCKDKLLTNVADPVELLQNDSSELITSKRHQAVNQGFMLDNTVSYGLRKANDGSDDVLQLSGAFSAFKANSLGFFPQIIQGVKDPERDFDAVNKRSTIVEDEKQVEDPLTHNLYDRLPVGDRVL